MPKYNRNYKKRSYKKPWYNRKYTPSEVAYRAFKGVNYLKGIINSEKHHHTLNSSVTPSTSGSVISLHEIAQGDTDSTRTGNSILAKSLAFRFLINMNPSATQTYVRILLIQDKQQIADTGPSITDVLHSASVQSLLLIQHIGRFQVLHDQVVDLDNSLRTTKMTKLYKKLHTHIRYNGSAASDIQKNGYYLMVLSNEATNTPTVFYNTRLSFYDN